MKLTWIPVFASILDSSLWDEPPHVRLLFLTLMFMKDPDDHIVREPMRRIATIAKLDPDRKKAYELAVEAMEILMKPDTKSEEPQQFEGRRIAKVEENGMVGWRVLNGEYYEKIRKELGARIRKTNLQRQAREKAKAEQSKQNGEANKSEPDPVPAPPRLEPPSSPPAVDRGSGIPQGLKAAAVSARQQPEAPVSKRRGPVQSGGVLHVTQAGMHWEPPEETPRPALSSSVPPPHEASGAGSLPHSPLFDGQAGLPPLEESDYPI